VEIVKKLMKAEEVDPCARNFMALDVAMKNSHVDVALLLLDNRRCRKSKKREEVFIKLSKNSI